MLLLLPLLTFISTFLVFTAIQAKRTEHPCRIAFLQASGFVGAYLILSAELLGLASTLNTTTLSMAWLVAFAIVSGLGWRRGWLPAGGKVCIQSVKRPSSFELASIFGFALIIGLLFLVAVSSPPSNTDAIRYHMSRVAHWVQNQSLRHYATGYIPQLVHPIIAETAILNLRLLWGDDRLANLVQWSSMIGTLIGATFTARLLGASRRGQLLAAAFAISIPMGLMQATSAQNDYVVAFWLISLSGFATLRVIRPLTFDEELGLGLALALGLLTKGTFYPYAMPIVLWFFIHQVRGFGWKVTVKRGPLVAIPVLVLNLGYWVRNVNTFGGPLGSLSFIDEHTFLPKMPMAVISAMFRNIAMHFVSPYEELNAKVADQLLSVFGSYDQTLANFELTWGWNHEDLAANPIHLVLVSMTVLGLVLARRRLHNRRLFEYSLVTASVFVMMALVVKFDPWGIRYQLPFWIMWAPAFGVVIIKIGGQKLASTAIVLLLLSALPWTFFNRTRPLIAMRDREQPERLTIPCDWHFGCTIGSVLVEPPETALFANIISLRKPYLEMAPDLRSTGCENIGLRIDSHDHEYLCWWVLGAPQSGIRIETVYPHPEVENLFDSEYRPCAVICTICGDRTELHGLPLKADYGEVKLYVGGGYVPTAY